MPNSKDSESLGGTRGVVFNPPAKDPRDIVVNAYERKFGRPPSRIQLAILRAGTKEEIMSSFGAEEATTNPGVTPLAARMRDVYYQAFQKVHGRAPTHAELEAVMAVGRHETIFGTAKFRGGLGPGMYNHGAVQCCKPSADGECPPGSFLSQDTTPSANGGDVVYSVCFKRYAGDVDGAADLVRIVGKKPLALLKASGGSLAGFATGMYLQGYFESTNAASSVIAKNQATIQAIQKMGVTASGNLSSDTKAGRVLVYALGLDRNAATNAKEMGVGRKTQLTVNAIAGLGLIPMFALMAVAFGLWKVTSTPKRGVFAGGPSHTPPTE